MKKWIKVIILLILLAGIAAGLLQYRYYTDTYIKIDGELYPRAATELDFRGRLPQELEKLYELTELKCLDLRDTGLTPELYDTMQAALPECRILWSVPFHAGYLDMEITDLKVETLTEGDMDSISRLEKLERVDATGCDDLETIFALMARFPDLDVQYLVPVGGDMYTKDTAVLTLENADPEQVETALWALPELTEVSFTGTTPDNDQIYDWMCSYPQIRFIWSFEVCGVTATSLDTQLILNEIPMESVEEVENALKYFYDLQWVEMCNCGIPSVEMDALWKRHPETRFVWMVQVGVCELRTDITSFMPYHYGYDGYSALFDRHMEEMKYCVDIICMDMGHMCISDYSFLAYMPHMQYLILADTPGTDFSVLAELKELKFLEIFMTTFDQAEVLVGLTSLEDLNIGTSSIDNIEPLLEMTWLKRLWLPGNIHISYEERNQLRTGLPDTIVMFATNSSTGGGWRESPNYYAMRDLLGMGYFKG